MTKLFFLLTIIGLAMAGSQKAFAGVNNNKRPQVGKTCPDFKLDTVDFSTKPFINSKELRGKWLILDFWGEYCTGCIKSFPKLKEMEERFKNAIQIVLITKTYKGTATPRALYKKIRSKFGLNFPVSYDQDVVNQFGIAGLPTIIIIDPNGIVKGITYHLTIEDLEKIMNGIEVQLPKNYLLGEEPSKLYNNNLPLIQNLNLLDSAQTVYGSMITTWKEGLPPYRVNIDNNRFEAIGISIKKLFNFALIGKDTWTDSDTAFYGKYYPEPIIDSSTSSILNNEGWSIYDTFCYSYIFPENKYSPLLSHYDIANSIALREDIKKDLLKLLGVYAVVEQKWMPAYCLIADQNAEIKLKTHTTKQIITNTNGGKGLTARNVPIGFVLSKIYGSAGAEIKKYIFQDKTNINFNIDIDVDAIYFDDWVREIEKYGLRLVKCEKKVNVITIKR